MKRPIIENNQPTEWGWMVTKPENFILGDHTDIGAYTYIQASQGVTIDDDVQIGSQCSIYSVNSIDGTQGPVHICENARVGTHTVIFPNVTIGKGAVIGAHSLVKEDVPAGELWYGQPAKFRRKL
jgi:acetyltransferase-like isoleucine patch superfamily enzyme